MEKETKKEFYFQQNCHSKSWGKIKIFQDKHKLRKLIATRFALQEIQNVILI